MYQVYQSKLQSLDLTSGLLWCTIPGMENAESPSGIPLTGVATPSGTPLDGQSVFCVPVSLMVPLSLSVPGPQVDDPSEVLIVPMLLSMPLFQVMPPP